MELVILILREIRACCFLSKHLIYLSAMHSIDYMYATFIVACYTNKKLIVLSFENHPRH